MKVSLVLIIIFLFPISYPLFPISYPLSPISAYAVDIGDKAPHFVATSLDGKKIDYSTFKGKKPLYLIFWATWCPNCKREIPHVVNLHKKLGDNIEFIGVNIGINENLEAVTGYIKSYGINFPIIYDRDGKIIRAFGVMGTPTHIIIDRNGVVRYRDAEMPEDLDGHLKELYK
ncbi:MAG: TlpA family protein disulfide reductase [Thermodesulfovibrionales bacterium]